MANLFNGATPMFGGLDDGLVVYPKIHGRLTAAPVLFSPSLRGPSAQVLTVYDSLGYTPQQLTDRVNELLPRPVHAVRAPSGKIGLLFGPPVGSLTAPTTHPIRKKLINQNWFRNAIARPLGAACQAAHSGSGTQWPNSAAEFGWATGRAVLEETQSPVNSTEPILATPGRLEMWRGLHGLSGLSIHYRGWLRSLPVNARVARAVGSLPPGIFYSMRGTYPSNWFLSHQLIDVNVIPEIDNLQGDVLLTPQLLAGTPYRVFSQGAFGLDNDPFPDAAGLGVIDASAPSPRIAWVMDDRTFTYPSEDIAAFAPATGFLGAVASAPEVGSWYPFPLVSQPLCYAYGLPHSLLTIMWQGEAGEALTSGAKTFSVDFTTADVTAELYKRLYPVSSLPEAQRASVSQRFDELPDHIKFRVGFFPKGLKYGSISYDETGLATDVSRANETLDAILLDHPESTQPPVGYGALGAKSLVAIAKGRNRSVAIVLASEGEALADISPIVFSQIDGATVATQGGYQREEGETMIALRAGATYSFEGGLDQDVVAQTFFGLPTWADVMGFSADSESSDYVIDEALLTGELMLDDVTDDMLARALPLLLGWDRQDFAATIAPFTVGALPQVIPA